MKKQETLAQLIYRTVLEFEQKQARLQQNKLEENTLNPANIDTYNQTMSKQKSA
ncbi:MAG: hypothetical protein AAFQ91_15705 [Cyanobacteria bacterium J06621_15]